MSHLLSSTFWSVASKSKTTRFRQRPSTWPREGGSPSMKSVVIVSFCGYGNGHRRATS